MNDKTKPITTSYSHMNEANEEILRHSGRFRPGPQQLSSSQETELEIVRAHDLDLQLEEFPEGPYGSIRNDQKLGKVTPWRSGQKATPRFGDANPVSSDRKVVLDEPDADAPMGSIEGQN